MPKKGENRKKEYDEKAAAEAAQVAHWFEQQAAEFERVMFKRGEMPFMRYLSDRGLEALSAFMEEERRRRDPKAGPERELTEDEQKALEGVKIGWDKGKA